MQHYDRSKIQEVPIADLCGEMSCADCHIGGCPYNHEGTIIPDSEYYAIQREKMHQ